MAKNYQVKQFNGDISRWIKATKSGLDDVVRIFLKSVYAELVMSSPVDTGRFRANWQITVNTIPLYAVNEYDRSGASTISSGNRIINSIRLGRGGAVTTVYFSNMLIYANALEYGHSKQAPAGVLGLVAVKLRTYFNNAVKESRAKNGL
ncbi:MULTISPECIES: HK97 gp10 family phage protein [Gammaproteobacteria]|uniref:HK97 gp10 family phage protein n=1 Tax=Gammaproteobacteria TaxID=1236 RepID=UPI002FCB57B4